MAVRQLAPLTPSDDERAELRALTTRGKTAQAPALRARIALAGEALSLIAIAVQQCQRNRGLHHPSTGETQANSMRVPPGSRTMKWILGPLPDRSGANSITVPGHAATRACNASSASRSTTFNAR